MFSKHETSNTYNHALNSAIVDGVETKDIITILRECKPNSDTLNSALFCRRSDSLIEKLMDAGALPNEVTQAFIHPQHTTEFMASMLGALGFSRQDSFDHGTYWNLGKTLINKYSKNGVKDDEVNNDVENVDNRDLSRTYAPHSRRTLFSNNVLGKIYNFERQQNLGIDRIHGVVCSNNIDDVKVIANVDLGFYSRITKDSRSTPLMFAIFADIGIFKFILDNTDSELNAKNANNESTFEIVARLLKELEAGNSDCLLNELKKIHDEVNRHFNFSGHCPFNLQIPTIDELEKMFSMLKSRSSDFTTLKSITQIGMYASIQKGLVIETINNANSAECNNN